MCQSLCQYFQKSYKDEYARTFLHQINRPYQQDDLLTIAKEQVAQETIINHTEKDFSIHDTDLLTILIWSMVKYKSCDPWITQQALQNEHHYYLLCSPNIPWKADPLRENPHNRSELFEMYHKQIEGMQRPYIIIKDIHRSDRHKAAVKWINDYL